MDPLEVAVMALMEFTTQDALDFRSVLSRRLEGGEWNRSLRLAVSRLKHSHVKSCGYAQHEDPSNMTRNMEQAVRIKTLSVRGSFSFRSKWV